MVVAIHVGVLFVGLLRIRPCHLGSIVGLLFLETPVVWHLGTLRASLAMVKTPYIEPIAL